MLPLGGHTLKIPANSVDAIVVAPPYFQGINHNGILSERGDVNISKPFFSLFYAYEICKLVLHHAKFNV